MRVESFWLERRHYSSWMVHDDLYRQLPVAFRAFALLTHRVPVAIGRRLNASTLFHLAQSVHQGMGGSLFHPISVAGVKLWLDLSDARCVRVPVDFLREPTVPAILGSILRPGSAFIDVGSNHGTFSVAAATLLSPNDLIVAVEPQPRLALMTQWALNDGPNDRSFVYNCALSDRLGTAPLSVPSHNRGEATLHPRYSGTGNHTCFQVAVRTLDELSVSHDLPSGFVLKIDAEGSEYRILKGGREVLGKYAPVLILEVNPEALSSAGSSVDQLVELLVENDYHHFTDLRSPRLQADLRRRPSMLPKNIIASKQTLHTLVEGGH